MSSSSFFASAHNEVNSAFKEEMLSLNAEFATLSAEAKKLEELIENNLKELLGE